jgi:hypothetical protein
VVGDRVVIGMRTDSLPANGFGRKKALDAIAADARGSLKLAFLSGGRPPRFDTDILHFWNYRAEPLGAIAQYSNASRRGICST